MSSEGKLLCVCNALLDISADVKEDLLEKYALKSNDAIMADEKHQPLYKELVDSYPVQYVAGGAGQNTARVAQWYLNKSGMTSATTYVGCVGDDDFGKLLADKAKDAGVHTCYMIDKETPTGTCAVLVTKDGHDRSLVANLAASAKYKEEHIHLPEVWKRVEMADFFYITGFFIAVSPGTIMSIAKHAAEHNKYFTMNLSAPFVSQFFKEPLMAASLYWDILFGNETEALTFSKEMNLGTENLKEIAIKIAQLPKQNSKRPRIVVITQGHLPTIVAQNGIAQEVAFEPLPSDKIVDTNSAGDAFVGGFMGALVQGKSIEECCHFGHESARMIIQQPGCTLPEN